MNAAASAIAAVSPALLRRLEPLSALSEERLAELVGYCRSERLVRNADLFRLRATPGQSVYLVAGELRLVHPDGLVEVLVGACDAAAWPLSRSLGAGVDAHAITDVELLRVDSRALDIMLTWDQLALPPADTDAAAGEAPPPAAPFRPARLVDGVLAQLPPANIDLLLRRLERVHVAAGDVVVREGDAGDYYYLIESGRCEVSRLIGGTPVPLAELKAGDAFGEEALVAGATRNASVTMRSDGVLLRLGQQDFVTLLREPLLHRVSRAKAERHVAAGAVWLDVRFPAEFVADRLPGAINIPLAEIRHAIGPLDASREYIVYCRSGRRSAAAAFVLAQRGYRACWLEGGLDGAADGKPDDSPRGA